MLDFSLTSKSPTAIADELLPQKFRREFGVRWGVAATQDAWWLLFTLLSYFAAYERAKSVAIGLATIEANLRFEFVQTLAARSDIYGGIAQDYIERLPDDPSEALKRYELHAGILKECLARVGEVRAA